MSISIKITYIHDSLTILEKMGNNKNQLFKFSVVLGIIGILILTFSITMSNIKNSISIVENPDTPYGYSWSNILWILPTLTIISVFLFFKREPVNRRAILWTISTLPLTGFILDILFAHRFFTFKNTGAVCGLFVYGLNFETMSFNAPIPIEEFIFYITGFLFTLTAYIFARDIWLSKYTKTTSTAFYKPPYPYFKVALTILILIIAGFILKAMFSSFENSLIPEYYLFIMLFGTIPFVILFPFVYEAINWEAFSFVLLLVLLISVIWEVTMGIPYGWWGYNKNVMIGLFIKPWFDLPIESVIVWISVSFTTVSLYEFFRLFSLKKA